MTERERLVELLDKKYDHFCDQCGVSEDSCYTENPVEQSLHKINHNSLCETETYKINNNSKVI